MTRGYVGQLWMDTSWSSEKIWAFDTKKPQYSPHKHRPINYGAKQKTVQPTDTSPPLMRRASRESNVLLELYSMREEQSATKS